VYAICLSGNRRKTCAGSNQIQSFFLCCKNVNDFVVSFLKRDGRNGGSTITLCVGCKNNRTRFKPFSQGGGLSGVDNL